MKKLLLVILVAACSQSFAVQEYYSIARSTRALGMGGAFYGLSDDQHALFYNPAGLATYRGGGRFELLGIDAQFSPSTISAIKTLTSTSGKSAGDIAAELAKYQGDPLYGAVGLSLLSWQSKNFAISLVNAQPKFNFALLGKDLDTSVDVTAIADMGVVAGYARSFMEDKLFVGLNAKVLARAGGRKTFTVTELADTSKGFTINPKELGGAGLGIDFDLGGTYQLPIPQWGPMILSRVSLVFNNLIASKFNIVNFTGDPAKIPGLVRTMTLAGYTALEGWGPFDNFNVLLDFAEFSLGGESDPNLGARGGSFFKHMNFGVEAPMRGGWFTPRLGFHHGYITAGVTFDLRAVKLDLATYAEELAAGVGRLSSRRFAMRLVFGWGSPQPAITGKDSSHDDKKGATPPPSEKEMEQKAGEKAAPPVDPNAQPVPVTDDKMKPETGKGTPQLQPQLPEDKKGGAWKPEPKPGERQPKSESMSPQGQEGLTIPAEPAKTAPSFPERATPSDDISIPQ